LLKYTSHSHLPPPFPLSQAELEERVGRVDFGQVVESKIVQFFTSTLKVLCVVFPNGNVLVVSIELVDVLPVYPPHHLQGLLAPEDSLLRDISPVAEILTGSLSDGVRDGLVGHHGYLLAQVDRHWLVVVHPPQNEIFHLLDGLYLDSCFGFEEVVVSFGEEFLYYFWGDGPVNENVLHVEDVLLFEAGHLVGQLHARVLLELDRGRCTMKNFFLN